MTDALVLGVNGQDGSYLAEELLRRGLSVTGIARQASPRWVADPRLHYVPLDLGDRLALQAVLARTLPRHIYHLAAVHGAAGHAYEAVWQDALAVNVGSVHTCLEHMRLTSPDTRLFYASSLKAFGDPPPPEVDEATPGRSTCLYGITKNAAADLIRFYRREHGLVAAIGFFFNHDSPRRPDSFFLPRLARHLISRARGGEPMPGVATLDFWCDWGSAMEYMELVAELMECATPRDAVFATGRPIHASRVAAHLSAQLGLPAEQALRGGEAPAVRARLSGLQAAVGRLPRLGALDVADAILADRLARMSKERGK